MASTRVPIGPLEPTGAPPETRASSVSRSLSFGFYLVGCGALVVGFALAVRGPVRLGGASRTATAS